MGLDSTSSAINLVCCFHGYILLKNLGRVKLDSIHNEFRINRIEFFESIRLSNSSFEFESSLILQFE